MLGLCIGVGGIPVAGPSFLYIVFCFVLGSFLVAVIEVGVDLMVSGRLPSDGRFVVCVSFVRGSGVGVDAVVVDAVGYLPLLIWDGVGSGGGKGRGHIEFGGPSPGFGGGKVESGVF